MLAPTECFLVYKCMGVSKNRGKTPKSSILIGYKPSILGYHYFWKHPYIYIYGTPPPPRPILSQNLLVFALFCCFLLCLNVCFFWRLFYIFKKLCRVVKTLPPLIKLFSFNRKGFLQNLEKTKKPKNQNFLEKFWFQVKRCFFLVFLDFFFGLDFFWFFEGSLS